MNDFSFTSAQQHKALRWLVLFHIAVIASSNYLVQFPFTITLPNGFAVHSTWGALSFPFIFLATDLTVRIFGQRLARRIIFRVMFPALLLSYVISVLFHDGTWTGWGSLADFQPLVFRIALASFAAYAFGQVMDIFVFNRLRQMKAWWVAPTASTFAGNALDTVLFFSIAFHASSDPFMAENWPHIALVDYLFKLAICTLMFVPAYGVLLNVLTRRLTALRSGEPQPCTTEEQAGIDGLPHRAHTRPAGASPSPAGVSPSLRARRSENLVQLLQRTHQPHALGRLHDGALDQHGQFQHGVQNPLVRGILCQQCLGLFLLGAQRLAGRQARFLEQRRQLRPLPAGLQVVHHHRLMAGGADGIQHLAGSAAAGVVIDGDGVRRRHGRVLVLSDLIPASYHTGTDHAANAGTPIAGSLVQDARPRWNTTTGASPPSAPGLTPATSARPCVPTGQAATPW